MSTEASSLMRAMQSEVGSLMGVDADADQLDLLRDPDTGKLPANAFQLAREQGRKAGPGRPAGARNRKSDQLAKLIVQQHGDPVLGMAAIYAMPLDQLVELLIVADGSKEREDRLLMMVDRVEAVLSDMVKRGAVSTEQSDVLDVLTDRMSDLTRVLKSKPGELALKALNTQLAARREVAQYVHGKMPIQVDHNTKADVILNIPGLTDGAHLADMVNVPELSEEQLSRLQYTPFEPTFDEDDADAD